MFIKNSLMMCVSILASSTAFAAHGHMPLTPPSTPVLGALAVQLEPNVPFLDLAVDHLPNPIHHAIAMNPIFAARNRHIGCLQRVLVLRPR